MKPQYLLKHLRTMLLALATLLPAFAAWADLPYADKPLFYATGVRPNVLMMIDNSGSMVDSGSHDTGTNYPYLDVCNNNANVAAPGSYTAITRYEAAMQAACQVVLDNASGMRIGFSTFDGEGESKHDVDVATTNTTNASLSIKSPVGSSLTTLLAAILATGVDGIASNTPLDSTMYALSRAYRGKTYRDSGADASSTSPIQYRCQKNYLLYFTDGAPNDSGTWGDSSPVMMTGDPVNNSPWNAISGSSPSWSGGLPNWDGYSDYWNGGDSDGEIAWMDDIAQMLYDTDLQVDNSAAYGVACPADAENTVTSATEDCSGISWDDPDFPTQNVVTYTVGFGDEANNEMMRDTPLVNQHAIAAADVNATTDTIAWTTHGLEDGQYVHYYANYVDQDYSTSATTSTGSTTLTGNTLNMAVGDTLTYSNGGGAHLQYRLITTPAIPGANCGAIGGLTSGSSYYVDGDTADRFRLSTNSPNAYAGTAINLTSTGVTNTVHSFTRTHASAGFITDGSGPTPVNTTANYETITRTAHGLNTGDYVSYTCTGTGCTIAGLTSGNFYYVARRSADVFRLAATTAAASLCAAAADNTAAVGTNCINLSGFGSNGGLQTFQKVAPSAVVTFSATGAQVDTGNERINFTAHGFNVGDRVTYACSNYAGVPAVYTSYDVPTTVYARTVVANNPGTFEVSLTSGGAALETGASAGTGSQSFSWTKPVMQTAIGGLYPYETDMPPDDTPNPAGESSAKGKYYVKTAGDDAIQLVNTIRYGRSPFETIQGTFAGTNASTSSTDRRITISGGHTFLTGDAVVYTCPNGCTGGLTNGTTYYVGRDSSTRIRLATTLAAAAGCATGYSGCVSFTSTDTDSQFLTHTPTQTVVDLSGTTGTGVLSTGPGKSYFATSAAELSGALTSTFTEIRAQELSFGTLGANDTDQALNTGTRLYQPRFNTADWSGDVRAFKITAAGKPDPVPEWEASQKMPAHGSRNILTRNNTNGAFAFTSVAADWAKFTAVQKTSLGNGGADAVSQAVLNWTRGQSVATYRVRSNGILGDFLNSGLAYVGQPKAGYQTTLPDLDPGKSTYNAFRAVVRTPMVYGGSNDGMVHGFEASTTPATQGVEKVAFIPEGVYMDWVDADNDGFKDAGEAAINKFYDVARSYYGLVSGQPHHYFVNATPKSGDAFFSTAKAGLTAGNWHTVLVGGLGKGGRSVYALDVTNTSFAAEDVLWEFNDGNSGDMGYSYGEPVIERLSDGQWVAIFGNGYDSRADQARMYIVNLETGALIREITLGVAGNNGLSTVTVLRSNTTTDGVTALTAYAGDLQGNVWKVNISNAASLPTSVTTPFFVAQDSSGNRQAITSAITIGRYPSVQASGVMLFFGTGSYFTDNDKSYSGTPLYDAMYGVWDKGDVATVALADLVQQQLYPPVSLDLDGDGEFTNYRKATSNTVNYSDATDPDRGWFMKMAVTIPTAVYQGERIVFTPSITNLGSYVLLTTVVPATADPCVGGGSSDSFRLDALSGGAKPFAAFDLDDDGSFDNDEAGYVSKTEDGMASGVTVFEDADSAGACVNLDDPECGGLNTETPPVTPGSLSGGRMSWRQLQ